jgi:hypothetical protein
MQTSVPAVEVADDADGAGVRRPDPERDSGDAVHLARVCAEPGVQLLVPPLSGEVDVELAERRQERVRVAEDVRVAGRVADLELVVERQLRSLHHPLEDPVAVLLVELDAHRQDADRLRVRAVGPHDHAASRRMGAEVRVRVGELVRRGRRPRHVVTGSSSRMRRIPATGIGSQSGLMLSS